MANINISLVGGQTMPVYQGFKEPLRPDKVFLIHSFTTIEDAKSIGRQITIPFELKQFDAFNYPSILKSTEKLLDNLVNDNVIINITSGTKPWAVAFSLLAINRENCTIIYFDQNSILQDLTHQYLSNTPETLNIATIFKYNNQSIPRHVLFSDYTEEDTNVMKSIIRLRSRNQDDFNAFALLGDYTWKQIFENTTNPSPHYRLYSGSEILYERAAKKIFIKIKNKRNGFTEMTLHSPHVENLFFNTGWFEYEVAKMISEWRYCKDIWMNVAIPYSNNNPKNEIDVLVSMGKKLLFVECKTQVKDTTDIDKFHSAVYNFGGWSSKAIFITRNRMTSYATEKCKDNDMLCFSFEDAISGRKAREKNYSNADVWEIRKRTLFQLLEEEMSNNNT